MRADRYSLAQFVVSGILFLLARFSYPVILAALPPVKG
jgi:hypothetical protein